MTYRVGVAGGQAAAAAMAAHLNQKTLPVARLALSEYYRGGPERKAAALDALASGMNVLPQAREDLHPALARALGVDAGGLVRIEALANILGGRTAAGEELAGHQRDVRTYGGKDAGEPGDDARAEGGGETRNRVSYMDFCFSVPKSVSVAWMAAATDAERNAILQACRAANDRFLRYVEEQIGVADFGKGRGKGGERGRFAWITCTHFTSRPTLAITRPDPATGVVDTEMVDVAPGGLLPGDPQIHFHNVVPNLMATDSGRLVSVNRDLLRGRIHEFGAVGQAFLAAELEALGIQTALDERTHLLHLPCIPRHVCDEFSKRTRGAEDAAREVAREAGLEWDGLDADRKIALLKGRAQAGRRGTGDDLASLEAWRRQIEALGWEHRSAVAHGPPNPFWDRDARLEHGLEAARHAFAPELEKRAVVEGFDARLAAARGLIASGGTTDAADVGAITRAMAERGVVQEGHETRLIWRDVGRGRVKLTTELHRDAEGEVIRLARAAAADTSRALGPERVARAVEASGFDYSTAHGRRQRDIIDRVGAGGELGVFLGVAGVGKTSRILPPLVSAWHEQGRDVWGVAQAWRQARELRQAGVAPSRTRALQPFLDDVAKGRAALTADSVVVLDELSQIGTRQVLDLLRLRERIGFSVVMTGDDRQAQSIKAGPVIELLRRSLGTEAIPEIHSTVRQRTEEGQKVAALFRSGEEGAVIRALRSLRERGEAELVPGGYQDCVDRVADLYLARVKATHNLPDHTVTVTAPTNADALAIGRAIRERLQAAGEVSREEVGVLASDGAGNLAAFAVAAGDKVRLYQRTWGRFTGEDGRHRGGHVGDNGSVLRVVEAVRDPVRGGLRLETAAGKVAFVPWDALRDRDSRRLKLGLGYCLTIDSAQGITSDEHISAMPGGSSAVQAFKGYVQASRHRVTHWMVGSRGAEMREVLARRPQGLTGEVPEAECWGNVARNLARAPLKELATDMLAAATREAERGAKTLQSVLRLQEARAAAGQALSTLRRSLDAARVREALAEVVARLEAAMRARAPLLQLGRNVVSPMLAAFAPTAAPVQGQVPVQKQRATAAPEPAPEREPRSEPARQDERLEGVHSLAGESSVASGHPGHERPATVPRPAPTKAPEARRLKVSEWEAQRQLADVLRAEDFDLKGLPVMDGQRHYVPLKGQKRGQKSGAYRAFYDGIVPAAAIWNHKTGRVITWKAEGEYVPITPQEAERIARRQAEQASRREREERERRERGAREAGRLWGTGRPATAEHPYVAAKGIDPAGLRVSADGGLLVPLFYRGELVNVQTISPDGEKRPVYGARKVGASFLVGEWRPGEPLAFAEGLATAKSFRALSGVATVVCLDTSNLLPVAREWRAALSDAEFWFAADNDAHLPAREGVRCLPNVGVKKATEAAAEVGGRVLPAPELAHRTAADTGTDWDDYAREVGRVAAAEALAEMVSERADPVPSAVGHERSTEEGHGIEA